MIVNVIYHQNLWLCFILCREDMQVKTDHIADKAKATRDLMIKVEKAAAEHSKAGAKAAEDLEKQNQHIKQYDQYGYVCNIIYIYIYNCSGYDEMIKSPAILCG